MNVISTQVSLSVMHTGWKTLIVPPTDSSHITAVRVQVDGHQNKVRVRQIQILAPPSKVGDGVYPAVIAQQKACEAEALRVFRSLTSQVRINYRLQSKKNNKKLLYCVVLPALWCAVQG